MREISEKEIVVYTGIFDDYDVLTKPINQPNNLTFVCFTDDEELTSEWWEVVYLNTNQSPNLDNRMIKMLPHKFLPNYNYNIYVDGNIQPIRNLTDLISKYLLKDDMAVPNHPMRNCIYEEAKTCIDRDISSTEKIREQMESYRESGFPEDYGLSQNNVILRVHNKEVVQDVMNSWWEEFKSYPTRDQLSLPYICWTHNFDYTLIDEVPKKDWLGSNPDGYQKEYFRPHPHVPDEISRSTWELIVYTRCKLGYGISSKYLTDFFLIPSFGYKEIIELYNTLLSIN